MVSKLVIWGAGGHAREVNMLCEELGEEVLGFLDERPEQKGKIVDGKPVLGDLEDIEFMRAEVKVVCAGVGDPLLKRKFVHKTNALGFSLCGPLIHPSVVVAKSTYIGIGSVISAGCILTVNVNIGEFVIANMNSTIAHDVQIRDFVTISPGVNISGNVILGEGSYVGTGAAIREKITVGDWSVIGGGAFVASDVPAHMLYAGVPAVYKKSLYKMNEDEKWN
jgi:sugar O-acyltransferase (sialic acid O-acetyltransferase NeuD family)